MSDNIVKKLKKYVLYISAIFFVILGIHLGHGYLYNGAKSEAIEGGTVSEAIIGSFPLFNPLVPSSDHNAYINGLLYRSMMEYSTVSESLESDLVSCNTENLLYIQCTLENNLSWSDGSEITTDDIKATLNIISETKVNSNLAKLLKNTTIETTKDSISFSNTSKDIDFLEVLLQPILPSSVIERLDTNNIEGKFSEINGIYSGRFVLTSISQDETVGITKITLGKNEYYFGSDMYINFLILNLFRDETHLLKNKNSFKMFNDRDSILGTDIPRLSSHEYTLPRFVASFFNTETLPLELRRYISNAISRTDIVENIGKSYAHAAYNPFLSQTIIDTNIDEDYDFAAYLKNKGYYSKTDLLKNVLAIESKREKQNALISAEVQIIEPEVIVETIKQETLSFITSPYTDKYNFISKDNILIKGKVNEGVDTVYINDYKLSGFDAGDDVFYYRLSESYDTISEGENTYTLYFESDGKKEKIEEFVYIYNTDSEKLTEIEENYFSNTSKSTDSKEREGLPIQDKEIDTTTIFETSLSNDEIQDLDESFYYTPDGEIFSLRLSYNSDKKIFKAIEEIQKSLEAKGIKVIISSYSTDDIAPGILRETISYDIIVIGVNLGYNNSKTYSFFHSSQISNRYNFANYKKLSLDILLEELKSNNLSVTKREELEEKMLDIIGKESIIKVLYTPKINLLVDKNIKNFEIPSFLPDSRHRYYPLLKSYLSEKKIIQHDEKGFFDFIQYLFQKAFR